MALNYTTNPGGLFVRLGQLFGNIRNLNGLLGTVAATSSATWGASGPAIKEAAQMFDTVEAQYQSALQSVVDGIFTQKASFYPVFNPIKSVFQSYAQQTLIQQVNANTTLPNLQLKTAMAKLIAQMGTDSQTVRKNVVSVTPAAVGGNVGSGVLTASVIGPNGKNQEYMLAETMNGVITADRNFGAAAGSEKLTLTSPPATGSQLDYNWPQGSGLNSSLTTINPQSYQNAQGNLLNNSDLVGFTANLPNNWVKLVGTAGSTIQDGTSNAYVGSHCLQYIGNGSELTSIHQQLGNVAGTTQALKASTVYAFNFWYKLSSVPAAGVLSIDLWDGTSSLINNDQAAANQVTVNLASAGTTSYQAISGYFQTPTNLGANVYLRIRLTTALSNAVSLYLSFGAMTPATQLYTGSPYAALFRGAADFVKNDAFTLTVANDYAGVFQTAFDQVFGMKAMGLQLPSATSGSQTIADTLVV